MANLDTGYRKMVRNLSIWVASLLVGFASPLGANAETVWKTFVDPTTIGMTAGFDLMVGTSDDVPPPAGTTGFNSTGSLAHLFFFNVGDQEVVAAASFTSDITDPSSLPLGMGGTLNDFSVDGRSEDTISVNGIPLVTPYSLRDDPNEMPYQMVVAPDGRSFTIEVTQESCLDTDAMCLNPLSVIDLSTVGIVFLPGDDPEEAWDEAPANFRSIFITWTNSQPFDVPAYLTQLSNQAPEGWAAISLTTFSILMDAAPGDGNVSGIQAPIVDGSFLVGVIPNYTLPEPGGASTALAVTGVLAALGRRRLRTRPALGRV